MWKPTVSRLTIHQTPQTVWPLGMLLIVLTFHDFDSLSFRMIQSVVVTSCDHGPKDSVDGIAKEPSLTRLTNGCRQSLEVFKWSSSLSFLLSYKSRLTLNMADRRPYGNTPNRSFNMTSHTTTFTTTNGVNTNYHKTHVSACAVITLLCLRLIVSGKHSPNAQNEGA